MKTIWKVRREQVSPTGLQETTYWRLRSDGKVFTKHEYRERPALTTHWSIYPMAEYYTLLAALTARGYERC